MAEIDREILRKRITEKRTELKLNQAQLAEKSGVTPAAISQIESGDRTPTVPVLQRIASILGVSLDYLIGKSEKSKLEDLIQNEEIQSFYRDFQSLASEDRDMIFKQIQFLKKMRKQSKR